MRLSGTSRIGSDNPCYHYLSESRCPVSAVVSEPLTEVPGETLLGIPLVEWGQGFV